MFEHVYFAQREAHDSIDKSGRWMHRIERTVNVKMMFDHQETRAFMSTSKSGYQSHFWEMRRVFVLLEVHLAEPIPRADYTAIIENGCVYMSDD